MFGNRFKTMGGWFNSRQPDQTRQLGTRRFLKESGWRPPSGGRLVGSKVDSSTGPNDTELTQVLNPLYGSSTDCSPSDTLTSQQLTAPYAPMAYRIIINKGMRDGSWIADPERELTIAAQDLLRTILRMIPDDRFDIGTGELAAALLSADVASVDETFQDSLRELVDLGCIRIVRTIDRQAGGRRAAP